MCGIIGYAGRNNAVPYLIQGLKRLEYRGYDSSGIALAGKDGISVLKREGKVSALESAVVERLSGNVGIGHTRWATHGKPSQLNAHPHLSENGLFAVVHNGIIENCSVLRANLEADGYSFISDTDTEVIAQLLESNYNGDLISCIKRTADMLKGSFAVAMLMRDMPDTIICMKKGSPLIVAKTHHGFTVLSDIIASGEPPLLCYYMNDGELALVTEQGAEFYGKDGLPLEKAPQPCNINFDTQGLVGFPHYMLKEIYEQPEALRRTLSHYIKDGQLHLPCPEDELRAVRSIHLVACGSAYHAGLCASYVFHTLSGRPTTAHIASEFRYSGIPLTKDSLVIIISQSGETADSLGALLYARENGAKTLSVVNVPGSSIALNSRWVLPTYAGPEIAVATTKAFTCQLGVLYILAAFMCEDPAEKEAFINELLSTADKISLELTQAKKALHASELIKESEHIYFIGRSTDYALSAEGALKMKEISYIHCEAYPAGELKHGTISLIEKGTPVVAVCLRRDLMSKTLSAIKEVKARGAFVIALTQKGLEKELHDADFVISLLSDSQDAFTCFGGTVPLQLMSYYTALERGCDIDKPRNLAKSVTVE